MQKWEYLVLVISGNVRFNPEVYRVNDEEIKKKTLLNDYLHELGEQGWELIAIRGDAYYFKRPLNDEATK